MKLKSVDLLGATVEDRIASFTVGMHFSSVRDKRRSERLNRTITLRKHMTRLMREIKGRPKVIGL